MSYSEWAVRIVRQFFGPQYSNQRVRLMVTRGLLDQTFPDLGGAKGFLQAMRVGPEWGRQNRFTMHERGLDLFQDWKYPARMRPREYPKALAELNEAPPFLPYLCLLCLAWTEGDEALAANAYYDRLTTLYPNHDLNGNLGNWIKLWDGVEEWTKKLGDKWGRFVVERLGGMVHVGIPRSQVIFTPAKIDRFPELFVECGLEPEATITPEFLRSLLLARDGMAAPLIGAMVFTEIRKDSALGRSALAVIVEHLENWDGDAPSRTEDGGNGGCGSHSDLLYLALQATDDNTRWRASFVIDQDPRCEQIVFPARRWRLQLVSETLSTTVEASGGEVDASDYFSLWPTGLVLNGVLQSSDAPSTDIVYRLRAKRVRIFDRWIGAPPSRLVECVNLPAMGPVYVLVHSTAIAEWQTWLTLCQGDLAVSDITWAGLPSGQSLFCINDISPLSAHARASFPDGAGATLSRSRPLRLASGTRCNTSTARRVYTDYDPPLLIVQSPSDAMLNVAGATTTLLDDNTSSNGLPGNIVHCFSLTVDPGQSVVVATVEHGGKRLGAVTFGIHRERAVTDTEVTTLLFDNLGNTCATGGLNGVLVPLVAPAWKFTNGPHDKGEPLLESFWEAASLRFIESLCLHAGRLPYPEYKRRAVHIGQAESWRVSEETYQLAELGFIELQTDSHGRWSYVHPVALQLYPLPNLADGRYQMVLTGCSEARRLMEVVKSATELLDCEARVTRNKLKLVPPRIVLLHPELAAGQQLAQELDLKWSPQPPSHQLSTWAKGLSEWLGTITWYPDPGPRPSAEYSPEQFRFVPHEEYNAPWHLRRFVDPFTLRHWHNLYRPANCRFVDGKWEENGEQHAYVRDFTWAMWRVHMAIAEDDGFTSLAFDGKNSSLILPGQLHFPYLLGRALATCSGLPLQTQYGVTPYVNHALGVLVPDAQPFSGQCSSYQFVPRPIAEIIAQKVNARLVVCDNL